MSEPKNWFDEMVEASETAKPEPPAPPPKPPAPKPRKAFEWLTDPGGREPDGEGYYGNVIEQQRENEAAAIDKMLNPEPAPPPQGNVPSNVPPPLRMPDGRSPDAMDWNPDVIEDLGYDRLAGEVRDFKATVFGYEGEQQAKNLMLRSGQRPYGRFGTMNPDLVKEELAFANIRAQMRNRGIANFYDLPEAERAAIKRIAENMADQTVKGILGTSESRGNIVVDLNPEHTMAKIADGETALGYLTGVGFLSQAQEAYHELWDGTELEALTAPADAIVNFAKRTMAPFYAMGTAGGKSVQAQGDTPVLGVEKESKLSWFFRAGLWSVIGAAAFNDELETYVDTPGLNEIERTVRYWGSPEHIERIYAEGYDFVGEMRPLANQISKMMPWLSDTPLPMIGAFVGIAAAIMVEPDLTALTLGVGKLGKLRKLAAPGKMVLEEVFSPWMAKSLARLDAGESIEAVLESVPRGGPLDSLVNAMGVEFTAELLARRAALSMATKENIPFRMTEILESTAKHLESVQDQADALRKTRKGLTDEAATLERVRDDATDMAAELQDAAKDIKLVLREEAALYADVLDVARSVGMKPADVIRLGTEPELIRMGEELGRLNEAHAAARKVMLEASRLGDAPRTWEAVGAMQTLNGKIIEVGRQMAIGKSAATYNSMRIARAGTFAHVQKLFAERGLSMPSALARLVSGDPVKGYKGILKTAETQGGKVIRAVSKLQKDAEAADIAATAARGKAADVDASRLKLSLEAKEIKKGLDELSAPRAAEEIWKGIFSKNLKAAAKMAASLRRGDALDDVVRPLDYQASVTGKLFPRIADEAIEFTEDLWPEWVAKATERYGHEAVSEAIQGHRKIAAGVETIKVSDVRDLFEMERSLAQAERAGGGLSDMATLKLGLDDIASRPMLTGRFSLESFMARGLATGNMLTRIADPILSRGLANSPEVFKDVYRSIHESWNTARAHMGRVLREHGPDAMMDVLTTDRKVRVGGSLVTFNQGGLLPYQKFYQYAKAVARLSPKAFAGDVSMKAIATAWLPSARSGAMTYGSAARALQKMIEESTSADDLWAKMLDTGDNPLRKLFGAAHEAVDSEIVARRFLVNGVMHAAVQYDGMEALLKAAGPKLSNEAIEALDFMTGKARAQGTPVLTLKGLQDARTASEVFRLPMTEAIATGRIESVLGGMARINNELVRVATEAGDSAIPLYMKQALDEIPRGLSKELEQFNAGTPVLKKMWNRWWTMWRHSVVNGWFFPRIAHYGTTAMGDFFQQVSVLGVRDAVRITANSAVVGIPFIGQRLNRIIQGTRAGRMVEALTSPEVTRLMDGDELLTFMTKDGPRTASQILEEGRSVGAFDSISGREIEELMSRVPKTRWSEFLNNVGFTGPSLLARQSAEYMEGIQHRMRMQIFAEARVGRIGGKGPQSVVEAGKTMRDTMLDWRLGITAFEAETVGKLAAFWTYRRQAARQMAAIVSGDIGGHQSKYLWRALTGNTPLGRTRKVGALLNAIPEAYYWSDPEAYLDDEQQVEEWARRQSPWWRGVEPALFGYKLSEEKQLWYSDVAGKPVSYESLMLPGLTTLDALYQMNIVANYGLAASIMAMEEAGQPTGLTVDDVGRLYEQGAAEFASVFGPGIEELVAGALGAEEITSTKGVGVPRNLAVVLNRLGWGEFMATYTDKDGRMRYVADSGILRFVGRLIAQAPPTQNLLQTYAIVDNPGFSESVPMGLAEGFGRLSGLVRFGQMDPVSAREWEIRNQDREFKNALRSARAQAGER